VGLDTIVQVQQHLHLRHYDDFMKKGGSSSGTEEVYVSGA